MRACEHARGLDDRVCSEWFAVEQGLRQGCVFGSLSCPTKLFFAATINEDGDGGAGESNRRRRVSPVDAALGHASR